MDWSQIIEEIIPWAVVIISVWGGISETRKKKKRSADGASGPKPARTFTPPRRAMRQLQRQAEKWTGQSFPDFEQRLSRMSEFTTTYTGLTQPSVSAAKAAPRAKADIASVTAAAAESEGQHSLPETAPAPVPEPIAKTPRKAALNSRERLPRRDALRRAIVWGEILAPKFKTIN